MFSWYGLLLPANTPKDIVSKLNTEIARITKLGDIQQKMSDQGIELIGGSSQEFARFYEGRCSARWAEVIKSV